MLYTLNSHKVIWQIYFSLKTFWGQRVMKNNFGFYFDWKYFPSIRVFSNQSALHIRRPKYWSFCISPSNECSGLISFRINWFDLLAGQGTLKSSPAPQFRSINSLALSLFMVQLSHPYMTTGKTIALTRWTLSAKGCFCFLKRDLFVTAFLPRRQSLLISWLQSPSAVILKPKKIRSVTFSTGPHLFAMKWWDQMPWS